MEPGFFDTGLGVFVIVLAQCLLVTVMVRTWSGRGACCRASPTS